MTFFHTFFMPICKKEQTTLQLSKAVLSYQRLTFRKAGKELPHDLDPFDISIRAFKRRP